MRGATQKFFKLDIRRGMRSIAEILGPLSRVLQRLGIDPRYPASLLMPRLYTLAPRLAVKLGDAS
jgi:hypothetical protein